MHAKPWVAFSAGAVFTVAAFASTSALPAQQTGAGQPLAKQAVLSSLATKLDTKKSKVGEPVIAKTLNPITLNDGTVLPSGTKILGKVTQAQSKSNGTASLGIIFDQVEKKGSAPMPIHGMIEAIAPLPDLGSNGGAAGNDLPMRGTAAQNAAQSGQVNSPTNTEQPIASGSSIKGVTLSTAPSADGSSVLQSTDKDIKLEGGTRLEIGLMPPK